MTSSGDTQQQEARTAAEVLARGLWRDGQAPAAVQGNPEYKRYKGTFGEAEFAAILKVMDTARAKAIEDGKAAAPMPEVPGSTHRDAADDSGICPVCGRAYQFPLRREGNVRVCSVGCLRFVEST